MPRATRVVLTIGSVAFVTLVTLEACSSFGSSSPASTEDGATPEADASALDALVDASTPRGPFCVTDGAYGFCWDFSTDKPYEGFEFPNQVNEFTVRRDTTTFTSAPGSWFSESRATNPVGNPPKQSAGRLGKRLGPPKDGTYRITFDVRFDNECAANDGPTIAELYCTTLDAGARGALMRVQPKGKTLEAHATQNGDGGAAFNTSVLVTQPITIGTWTHVEVEVNTGAAGTIRLKVGDAAFVQNGVGPVRCAGMDSIEFLLGTQGTYKAPSQRCAAWFDDVTLTTP